VLVTGSNSNVGSAIANAFAAAGASVIRHSRLAQSPLQGTEQDQYATGDLTSPEDVALLFRTVEALGPLDVLINNAGAYPSTPIAGLSMDEWRTVIAANLDSTFACLQQAAGLMAREGGGAIINIASISAHRPAENQSHYNASKAAVLALTKSAAAEYGPSGIRVNSVSPGLIGRPGIADQWPDGVQRWLSRAPLQRLGEPRHVSDACLFLASDMAEWITGADLVVDGGMLATRAY